MHVILDYSRDGTCVCYNTSAIWYLQVFLGIGEAGNWPAALKLTSELFSPHGRSTASVIFNSGSALVAIIVPPSVAFMGTMYGWQSTFIILGVVGYLWVASFWFMYYTHQSSVKEAKARIIPPVGGYFTQFIIKQVTF